MTTENSPRPRKSGAPFLSPEWRMILSFVLIIHITAIVTAVAAQTGNNAAARIRAMLFRPYLQALFMNTDYRFAHTLGEDGDVGYVLSSEVTLKDGSTKKLDLNSVEVSPPLRRLRYYRICRLLAENADSEDVQSLLAQSLADGMAGLWAEQGVTADQIAKMTLETRAHAILTPSEAQAKQDPNRPGMFAMVYAADVILQDGAPPILNRRGAAGEVAPAATDAGAKPAAPASTSNN